MYRNFIVEPDFFRHSKPIKLIGGRIERVGYEDQYALLTIPVKSLSDIEPFTLYDIVVRREFPPEAKGLPLKIKIVGGLPLEPKMYTGYSRSDECHHKFEGFEHDCDFEGAEHGHEGHKDCDVEVITEKIPAQVFDVTIWGYGNQATLNDIIIKDDAPYPFIRSYVNDKGDFVLLPPCEPCHPCGCGCRPKCKKVIVRTEEIVIQPFRAKTLGIKRTATPFSTPVHCERFDAYTQSGCAPAGCGFGTYNGIY